MLVPSFQVEPVGRWFQAHWNRLHAHRTISEHNESGEIDAASDDESDDDSSEGEEEIEFEDDIVYLRSLDPKVGCCFGSCWICRSRLQ